MPASMPMPAANPQRRTDRPPALALAASAARNATSVTRYGHQHLAPAAAAPARAAAFPSHRQHLPHADRRPRHRASCPHRAPPRPPGGTPVHREQLPCTEPRSPATGTSRHAPNRVAKGADSIRTSNTHYIKLAEAGAAENVVEKEIIYYLAALERKPTGSYSKNIVRGLDYAAKNGSDVIGMKDRYGFRSVRYPPPADEPQTSAEFGAPKTPLLSDDDARAAEQWYEKGYKAIYSGFQAQYEFYVKALQHNPNLAKAWHELQQACSEAGRYDLAERCDDAETILMSGKFIDNYRAVLEPETQLPAALATAPAISKATTPPSPGPKNADTRETRKWW